MGLYCFLGMLMDGPTTLATALIGLPIAPHFDEPFRSTSVRLAPRPVPSSCLPGAALGVCAADTQEVHTAERKSATF